MPSNVALNVYSFGRMRNKMNITNKCYCLLKCQNYYNVNLQSSIVCYIVSL